MPETPASTNIHLANRMLPHSYCTFMPVSSSIPPFSGTPVYPDPAGFLVDELGVACDDPLTAREKKAVEVDMRLALGLCLVLLLALASGCGTRQEASPARVPLFSGK